LMKSLLYFSDDHPAMVLIRGDHEVNESKLISILGPKVRPALREEVIEICGAEPGFVGPVNMRKNVRIITDFALKDQHDMTTGANEKDYHLSGIELERDVCVSDYADIRCVKTDDHCSLCGADLRVANAIELGHIFQLGTKYSESMKALYTDHDGKDKPIFMGSYGIGVERIVAASIEQNHDEKGIVWDPVLAPYHVHIIPINMENDTVAKTAEVLYQECCEKNIETLLDDRIVSPGYKFKDADLLGLPLQIIIGDKWIREQKIEIKMRKMGKVQYVSDKRSVQLIQSLIDQLRK
jgi:prolyl-tRNA synthetase